MIIVGERTTTDTEKSQLDTIGNPKESKNNDTNHLQPQITRGSTQSYVNYVHSNLWSQIPVPIRGQNRDHPNVSRHNLSSYM